MTPENRAAALAFVDRTVENLKTNLRRYEGAIPISFGSEDQAARLAHLHARDSELLQLWQNIAQMMRESEVCAELIHTVGKYGEEKGEEWRLGEGAEIMEAYSAVWWK